MTKSKGEFFMKASAPAKSTGHIKTHDGLSVALMMAPAVLMLVVCSIYPFIWVFRYICYEYNGMTAYFSGMRNFERMFQDAAFWGSVGHTFEYAILKLIFILPLALIMAVLIQQKIKGSGIFRVIYFMPTIISSAISALVFSFIFAAYNGVLNAVLRATGIISQNINWLGDSGVAMWSVLILAIWGGFGNYMIYFMSGLSSVPGDVYESAMIDGSSGLHTFFHITLPMLSPMLKTILMLAITTAFKDYESIMVLTNGGPDNRTMVMFLYIYRLLFGSNSNNPSIGYACVLSLMAAVIVGIVTGIYMLIARKLDDVM